MSASQDFSEHPVTPSESVSQICDAESLISSEKNEGEGPQTYSSIGSKSGLKALFQFKREGSKLVGICTTCPSYSSEGRRTIAMPNRGTSGLWSHLKKYHPAKYMELKPPKDKPFQLRLDPNSISPKVVAPFDAAISTSLLAQFVVLENVPFRKVGVPVFKSFVASLNPKYRAPNEAVIKETIITLYAERKSYFMEEFATLKSKISLTLDGWTSPNGLSIIGMTAHYINNEWQYRSIVLSFCHLEGSHTGQRMARQIEEVCEEYGIQKNLYSITCDNATSNDKMAEELETCANVHFNKDFRIRCLAHVVNLVAMICQKVSSKSIIDFHDQESELLSDSAKSAVKESEITAIIEDRIPYGTEDTHTKEIRRSLRNQQPTEAYSLFVSQSTYGKRKRTLVDDEINVPDGPDNSLLLPTESKKEYRNLSQSLTKIRDIITFFRSSPLRRQQLMNLQQEDELTVILDVPTRWNSTLHMITRAIQLRMVIESALGNLKDSPEPLSEDEWGYLTSLQTLLHVFEEPTLEASKDPAYLSMVHPLTLNILRLLLTFETEYGELCRAKEAAIEKLQSYWNKTKSPVYYFAVLLDPRLKKRFYIAKNESGLVDQSEVDHVELLLDTLRQYCEDNFSKQRQVINLEDDIFGSISCQEDNEVDTYLSYPIQNKDCDPLEWWNAYSKVQKESKLATIAKNIFAVQSSSVASERAFSQGRDVITDKRNRLSKDMVNVLLCCKSWLR